MKFAEGPDLSELMSKDLSAEELAYEHALDISASIYKRMKETGVTKTALAKKLGRDKSQVTRMLSAHQNMTIKTLASIETALDFRLGSDFKYVGNAEQGNSEVIGYNNRLTTNQDVTSISCFGASLKDIVALNPPFEASLNDDATSDSSFEASLNEEDPCRPQFEVIEGGCAA